MADALLVVLRHTRLKDRSQGSVIRSPRNLKDWMKKAPTVDEARPAACTRCAAASRPVGGRIQLQGHGLRTRQVWGPGGPGEPDDPDEAADIVQVDGRRYRCVCCGAVMLVVPQDVLPRRHYSAAAIAFALALWGLVGATASAVRQRVSPAKEVGFDAMTGWVTLRRWAKAVRRRELFASAPVARASATLREVARVAASALAASAEPATRRLPIEQRAFFGAAHAA